MNIERKYVVVDTGVLIKSSYEISNEIAEENRDEIMKAVRLLATLYDNCHILVIDQDRKILEEYYKYFSKYKFMNRWFVLVSQKPNKLEYRPRHDLKIEHLIDPDDAKFFEVAFTSPHKIFITSEEKLQRAGKEHEEIKRLGIKIWSVKEALNEL